MRFVLKLVAVLAVTFCMQIGYELASMQTWPSDVYGTNTMAVDRAIQAERRLNTFNPVTRRVVACLLAIPLPGECS